MQKRYRRGASFVMDARRYSRPLDRNERARILSLAEALERRTRPPGARNGVVSQVGLQVLRALLLRLLRGSDGLCSPGVATIQKVTGLSRSAIFEALNRLEASGILKRTRRLVRKVLDFGGIARLTTVQASNLYAFFEPGPMAHLLPVKRRIRSGTARLISNLCRSLSMGTKFAWRPGIYKGRKKGLSGKRELYIEPAVRIRKYRFRRSREEATRRACSNMGRLRVRRICRL